MDLKRIIKEEVNDFEWTEEVPSRLNTYRVTYRTELYIDAHTEEEAKQIYENLNLGALHEYMRYDEEQVGLKDYQWYETTSFEQEINESIKLPIEIGDTVYMGKFKNKKTVVKDIEWNEKGDLMINGKPALKMRIPKKAK